MLRYLIFSILIVNVLSTNFLKNDITEKEKDGTDKEKIVELDVGTVIGTKYWDGDFYEFYGVPYATAPTGRDKYKAPLPLEPFGVLDAKVRYKNCQQIYLTDDEDEEDLILDGFEDCLIMNVFTPLVANEENLLPILVYIHSGAYSGGNANMGRFNYLARHDVVVVSFNYRLGALGFACLGTEEIPGNTALKDQVAALKFIQKYAKKFGGDPNRVTLAGFSVGAAMAELLAISKSASGLIHSLILESGSALSPFAINRHPIETAKNLAISIGYNDTGNIKDLNEFLLNAEVKDLVTKSKNFFLTNSTFGLAPCLENVENDSPFMTESPLTILQRGDFKHIPIMTGFANMEGISRTIKLNEWSELMNEHFEDFLPADLQFPDAKSKDDLIKELKKTYFKDQKISRDLVKEYVDYFSDAMFKYAIMKSAKLHALKSDQPIFFYEFTYVGKLNMKHNYMEKLKGATHRDQTSYLIDFYEFTTNLRDMDTRDRMTTMWTDFAIHGNPTVFESLISKAKWPPYTNKSPNYLEIGVKLKVKKDLFAKQFTYWDKVYDKYYWNPKPEVKKSNK